MNNTIENDLFKLEFVKDGISDITLEVKNKTYVITERDLVSFGLTYEEATYLASTIFTSIDAHLEELCNEGTTYKLHEMLTPLVKSMVEKGSNPTALINFLQVLQNIMDEGVPYLEENYSSRLESEYSEYLDSISLPHVPITHPRYKEGASTVISKEKILEAGFSFRDAFLISSVFEKFYMDSLISSNPEQFRAEYHRKGTFLLEKFTIPTDVTKTFGLFALDMLSEDLKRMYPLMEGDISLES